MTTYYLPYTLLQAQSWTNNTSNSFETFTTAGATGFTAANTSGSGNCRIETTLIAGITYKLTFTYTVNSGSGTLNMYHLDSTQTQVGTISTSITSGSKVILFTPSITTYSGFLQFNISSGTINFTISSLTVKVANGTISPTSSQLSPVTLSNSTSSPFTGQQQIVSYRGQYWHLELNMPAMHFTQAKLWQTWFQQLNGRENTFYYRPIMEQSSAITTLGTSYERVVATGTAVNSTTATSAYDSFSGASTTGFTADSNGTGDGGSSAQNAGCLLTMAASSIFIGLQFTVSGTCTFNSGTNSLTLQIRRSPSATDIDSTISTAVGTATITTSGAFTKTITLTSVATTSWDNMWVNFQVPETQTTNFTISNLAVTVSASHLISQAASSQATSLAMYTKASTNAVMVPGDYFECNSQLFQVTGGTLNSTSGGVLTPNVWPYVRDAISANTPVYYQQPRGIFRLEDTTFSMKVNAGGYIDPFKIVAREAL
jgi:hypothetical protein